MDAFFDVVANLVPRGKEFLFCIALAYSSSMWNAKILVWSWHSQAT